MSSEGFPAAVMSHLLPVIMWTKWIEVRGAVLVLTVPLRASLGSAKNQNVTKESPTNSLQCDQVYSKRQKELDAKSLPWKAVSQFC